MNKNTTGFTMIEILVASYIFLVVVLAASMIFSSSVGAKMKASAFWKTQQESRYAMEKITRAIRDDRVKGFKVAGAGHQELILCKDKDCSGASSPNMIYRIYRTSSTTSPNTIRLVDRSQSTSSTFDLTSVQNVNVTDLTFDPVSSPSSLSTNQPFITIKMIVKNNITNNTTQEDSLTLKTTINLRNYGYKYEY